MSKTVALSRLNCILWKAIVLYLKEYIFLLQTIHFHNCSWWKTYFEHCYGKRIPEPMITPHRRSNNGFLPDDGFAPGFANWMPFFHFPTYEFLWQQLEATMHQRQRRHQSSILTTYGRSAHLSFYSICTRLHHVMVVIYMSVPFCTWTGTKMAKSLAQGSKTMVWRWDLNPQSYEHGYNAPTSTLRRAPMSRKTPKICFSFRLLNQDSLISMMHKSMIYQQINYFIW